jgi:hypothetical protein
MTAAVEKIVDQVRRLRGGELDELRSWLAGYKDADADAWDLEMAEDSRPGGRLEEVLRRVRRDIAEGRTKPLDEVLDNA